MALRDSTMFLQVMRSRTARVAISASASRGQGRGVVRAAREFCAKLALEPFAASDARRFRAALDRATVRLMAALPRGSRRWGVARKLLNIYLRDCLYHVHIAPAYRLDRAEAHFEIPLDGITGKRLAACAGELPAWSAVRRLDAKTSRRFQEVASRVAREEGIARVHLDALWWGQRED